MKKIFAIALITFFCFNLNANAYSILNVSNNASKYETQYKNKLILSKISLTKLKKMNFKITDLIKATEINEKLGDNKKEVLLGKLIALNNIFSSEINDRETKASLIVTVIDDKRCTNCMTSYIVNQLKITPFLNGATFIQKDFSDSGVNDYIKQNDIKKLPAVILSTKDIKDEGQMQPFLKKLADNQYYLELGSSFDPFVTRSEKGFLVLDKNLLNKLKQNTYLKGNKDAKISWIEFSDLECPFCAKLHNSDVTTRIKDLYGDKVNIYFNHFPLDFHQNAMDAAMIVECLAEQKGAEAYYSLIEKSFKEENSTKDFLIDEAIKFGADKEILTKCVDDKKYNDKILSSQKLGTEIFSIKGTPASILVNNETGEYELISGAHPFDNFKEIIEKLLK